MSQPLKIIRTKAVRLLVLPLSLITIFLQRVLSPIILLRISHFDCERIGNLYIYYWTEAQKNTSKQKNTLDIFFTSINVSNHFWVSLFKKKFHLFDYNELFAQIYYLNQKLSDSKKYFYSYLTHKSLLDKNHPEYIQNIIKQKHSYFNISDIDINKGKQLLELLGVKNKSEFICFHNRDSAYLNKTYPNEKWGYHDYRDSSISNYLLAADYLTKSGYFAIRTGSIVKELIHSNNEMIIDYPATKMQSEFLDVVLGSQCKLFICSDTGMSIIPELFDVPIVYVNWTPLARISNWVKRGIFIPKKFYSRKLSRDLTFKEILASPEISFKASPENFNEAEITLIENTPEEILMAVKEMIERINGRWKDSQEMQQLQTEYWSLPGNITNKSPDYTISSSYLMNNKHLLRIQND